MYCHISQKLSGDVSETSVILIQKEKRKKGKAQGKAQDSKQKKKEKKKEKKKTPCRIRTPALSPEDLSFSASRTIRPPARCRDVISGTHRNEINEKINESLSEMKVHSNFNKFSKWLLL